MFKKSYADIYPKIPRSTCIHHKGMGTIIGKGVVIGENCDIYHCVTIGEQYGSKPGVPTIGDNCRIYPFVMIIGGITIGDNVTVGSFTKVDVDIPNDSLVLGVPCKVIPQPISNDMNRYVAYLKELHG